MRDVFYSMKHMSLKQKRELFQEAKELCNKCFIDEKDEKYRRIPSAVTFEEMLQKMDKNCHYVFIQRIERDYIEPHLEVGFCTMGAPFPGDWFLFIYLECSHLEHFMNKYKLTLL
jgi:hypothetical protein